MVGTGVFTITGTAAATLAGPALVVSIVISAICLSFMLQYTLETWIAICISPSSRSYYILYLWL